MEVDDDAAETRGDSDDAFRVFRVAVSPAPPTSPPRSRRAEFRFLHASTGVSQCTTQNRVPACLAMHHSSYR